MPPVETVFWQAENACWTSTFKILHNVSEERSNSKQKPPPSCAGQWSLNTSDITSFSSGNLWEELREDSLVSVPQVTTTTSFTTSALQDHHVQTSCLHLAASPVCRRKAECEDENTEQHDCLNGLHPVAYSGVESLAGYLTSCTTSISLM